MGKEGLGSRKSWGEGKKKVQLCCMESKINIFHVNRNSLKYS